MSTSQVEQPPAPADGATIFAAQRDLLQTVAYRIVGTVTDAEDVVQEAWLRWAGVDQREVADPRAFLIRITTRLAIDRLRRIQARRESYVGPWLPEPLLRAPDVAEEVARADAVSYAMLVVLESLSPLERAVFVLREAFALPYAEIAEILERSEAAVRQLARRCRDHVRRRDVRFATDHETHRRVTERFLATVRDGDLPGLLALLAPDVTLVADSGGAARAPRRPIAGAERVARFFLSVAAAGAPAVEISPVEINGRPGLVARDGEAVIAALVLDLADGLVQTAYLVANPAKLPATLPRPAPAAPPDVTPSPGGASSG